MLRLFHANQTDPKSQFIPYVAPNHRNLLAEVERELVDILRDGH